MLTVALDATPLAGNRTGIGVAVTGLVAALADGAEDLELVGYGFTATGWRRVQRALPARVRPSRRPMPAGALLRVWARADLPTIEWWTGPVDVVHGTHFVVPPSRRAGRLVSVWDLTAAKHPEWCQPVARRYPDLIRRAVDRGAWVHTGSQWVADEVVEVFGVDRDRVRVVAPGIDMPAAPPAPTGGPPYVLGLGTVEPRKDFPGLVAAFDAVADEVADLELRLAGPAGWGERALDRAIASARHRDRIHRIGWVDDPGALVAGAAVFAYPSLYEGFGLPPLEAMARGTPVVASEAGSIPEVTGGAALLVPPGDPPALAAAIGRCLADGELRDRLVAAGYARARSFSWAGAARATAAVYREVAGGR